VKIHVPYTRLATPRDGEVSSRLHGGHNFGFGSRCRTSTKAIEQAYPHIIEMIVPLGGFGKKLDEMYEWHWARDIEAMRGCGWRDKGGRYYVRWCFFNLITAQDFARKFGGSIVKGR
jgi:hypothetical protein